MSEDNKPKKRIRVKRMIKRLESVSERFKSRKVVTGPYNIDEMNKGVVLLDQAIETLRGAFKTAMAKQ